MLKYAQVVPLSVLAAILWLAATLYIRLLPRALSDPAIGSIGFITALPMAWLSVLLTRLLGRLAPQQLMAGVGIVGALAMMADGIALRWFPAVYSSDLTTVRLGAAWLLWGYGVSLAVAVVMAVRYERKKPVDNSAGSSLSQ